MRAHSPIDWTAYPALLIAGSFGLGILAAAVTGSARSLPWGLACGTAVALFVGAQWWDARRLVTLAPLGRMGAVLLAVAAAGGLSYAVYTSSSPRDLERVAKITEDDVVLSGTVEDAPER